MASNFAKRALGVFGWIGQSFLEFAYEALPVRRDIRVKLALDFIAMQVGLAICCVILLLWVLIFCRMLNKIMYSVEDASEQRYQVEVTGVEATGFPGPQDMMASSSPRFNLTARVVNRKSNTPICLRNWQVDVWHAETPFGPAFFPDTCLEGMSETVVKASASNTELIGIGMHGAILQQCKASRESPGDLNKLRIEMTLNYYKGYDQTRGKFDWLWCHATTDMQSSQPPCRIHSLYPPRK